MIEYLPNYDKFGDHNKVYSVYENAPTILHNASKGYPPLILIEGTPAETSEGGDL